MVASPVAVITTSERRLARGEFTFSVLPECRAHGTQHPRNVVVGED
jgi:hypothetical protein